MGALKSELSNKELEINAEGQYEGVIVPTASYGAEAWSMRSVEIRKVNILEMKCLRSLVGVSEWIVWNEEARKRTGIKMDLASRVDQRVLRWFGQVERMDEFRMAKNGMNDGTKCRAGMR